MNEIIGANIMRLRKEKGMTQEQLANALGLSYQAVSKWETGNSSPDISVLPLLAELFSVSIDELFGRPAPAEQIRTEPAPGESELPWPDDECFYMVLYHGHELIGHSEGDRADLPIEKKFVFQYEGPAQDVVSSISVVVDGQVFGSVSAGENVECDAVMGDVQAGGSVTCDNVGGSVSAGGSVNCDDVTGSVSAGGSVACDDVEGSVCAMGSVTCDEVGGGVTAGTGGRIDPENMESFADLGRRISEKVMRGLGRIHIEFGSGADEHEHED